MSPSSIKGIPFFFFCALTISTTQAQLCQGSLGDPVANTTFGSGTSIIGKPLASYITNYIFTDNNGPSDGDYTIANISSSGAGNSWYSTTDHTGDPNGYFMIVNASYAKGEFYRDTIHNLCGSTTYEFASWIINLDRPNSICGTGVIRPNLKFYIEKTNGVKIDSIATGNIDPTDQATWKQFGLYFTTQPTMHDVVVRIINNADGGCGNDLGLDDITFRPCGKQASAFIQGAAGNRFNSCQGTATTVKLQATVTDAGADALYQWQISRDTGSIWQDIANADATSYNVTIPANATPGLQLYRLSLADNGNITATSCRTASNTDTIYIAPLPTLSVTGSGPVCTGGKLQISASSNTTVQWKLPGGGSSNKNSITIDSATTGNAGKYYVTAISDMGCSVTDSGYIATVYPQPVADAGQNNTVCKGSNIQLHGSGGITYLWTPSTGLSNATLPAPQAHPDTTTTYQLTVTSQYGCKDTASVIVTVLIKPTVNAGEDISVVYGQSAQLNGIISGNYTSFYWQPDIYLNNSQTLSPLTTPETDTTYVLYAVSDCGTVSDSVYITVYRKVEVPNVFSPNGDGIHDTWNIPALEGYPNAEVSVFSRYGMRIYYSKGYSIPWNGSYNNKKVPAGTYYYLIDLKDNSPRLSGSVTIL